MQEVEHENYIIEADKFGHYHIKPMSRGTVVKELRGTYTTVLKAIQAIDHIIAMSNNKKGKRDGTRYSTSGDQYI